jgi:AcrR family transcriptional regulator
VTASPTPRSRRRSSEDAATARDSRARIITAAIHCILERGFYRASSNAIAERAGLTWGVIQYYFGSRENLMLAVLEEGTLRLVGDLSSAEITGETLTERIEQFYTILEGYYADPEYLALTQVLLNLGHDPHTSAQTLETMQRINVPVAQEISRLQSAVFAGLEVRGEALRSLVFHVLRGLALSEVMLQTVPWDTRAQERTFPTQRHLLAEALTLLIEQQADGSRK